MLAAAVIRPRYFVALPHSYSLKPFLPRPLTSHLYTLTSTASLTPITSPKSPFSTTLAAMNHPPVALVLCGKSPMMARNFIEEINGEEYEIIHACHTLPAAESEIPSLLLSRPVAPASDETFLTNTTSKATRVPKAIVIGKGFSDDEVEQLMRSVRKAVPGDVGDKVVWLTPDDAKFSFAQKAKALASAGTLLPRVISDRVKVCLKEGGLVKGKEDSVQGGHWGF